MNNSCISTVIAGLKTFWETKTFAKTQMSRHKTRQNVWD